MEIKYNVQAPPKNQFHGGSKSEEVKAIADFLTSGNAKNFLKLRCSPAAHPQMREVALILLEKVHALIPVCFDDIWEEYHEQG